MYCNVEGNEDLYNNLDLLKEEVLKVMDIMLEVAEACIESSHESGIQYVI